MSGIFGVEFSQFEAGGNLVTGDTVVGLRNGLNTQFTFTGTVGTSSAVVNVITQALHGFVVGQIVRYNGTQWTLAQADTSVDAEVIGIVTIVNDANTFTLLSCGFVDVLSGLTPGATYFLSDTLAGALTTVEPVIVNTISKPLLIATSSTTGFFFNFRGKIVPGSSINNITFVTNTDETGVFPNSQPLSTLPTGLAQVTNGTGIISTVAQVNSAVLTSDATGAPVWRALTDGQIIIGSTAGVPLAASITAGAGITVTPGANSITIASTAVGTVTAVTATLPLLSSGGPTPDISMQGLTTLAQGDLIYGSAPATFARLTKDTNATRYLSNTGLTNNPAWAQIDLSNGVTGVLPSSNGGTGVNNGTSTLTLGGNLTTSGAFASTFTMTNVTAVTFPVSGTLATTAQLPTLPLSLANGGTNANLTANDGGIFYSTATAGAILSGTATANQVLLSGSNTTPSWSTATYPVSTTINRLLYSSSNNVITDLATTNSAAMTTNATGVPTWQALTDGQIVIGSSIGAPLAATITAGAGISIGNGNNTITITNTGAGASWVDQTSTPVTLSANTAYSANTAGLLTFNMPALVAFGSIFEVVGHGAGGWLIQLSGGQTANSAAGSTTAGGSLASTNRYDSIKLLCTVANTTFTVISSEGAITNA